MLTIGLPFAGESVRHFEMAVRSVYAQTVSDWQLLLIGDAPRAELAERATAIEDPRVRVTIHDRREGLATRLNESIAATSSEFYVRMDADDVMHPRRLELQRRALLDDRQLDLVGSRAIVIDDADVAGGVLRESPMAPERLDALMLSGAFSHPTVAGRTDWFSRHPYSENTGRVEDMELWLRTFAQTKSRKLSEPLLFYRLSSEYNRKKWAYTSLCAARLALRAPTYGVSRRASLKAGVTNASKAVVYAALPHRYWRAIRDDRQESATAAERLQWSHLISSCEGVAVPGWH